MTPPTLSSRTAAILAAVLCYGILTLWIRERWALAVYQITILAWGMWWAAAVTLRPVRVRTSVLLLPLAGVLLWGGCQLLTGLTVYRWQTWSALLDWAVNAVVFFLALQVCAHADLRRRLLTALVCFGAAIGVLATVQMFTSGGRIFWLFPSGYPDFILGPFVYRNHYAAFIEMLLPLALYRAVTDRRNTLAYWVMACIMVASVVAGASRAGSILVLAEVAAVPLLAFRRRLLAARHLVLGWGQFVALALVSAAVVGWDVLWQRFQEADPYVLRKEMLVSSLQMAREHPWTGFGLGAWATAYPAYALFDNGTFINQAHNDWAQWAAEGGIPLFLMMLAFGLLLVRPAFHSLWGVGLIFVLVHGLVDYPLQQRPALAGWFFCLAGLLASVEDRQDGIGPG